jgi:TDG/mug DNA glycosylase family protein
MSTRKQGFPPIADERAVTLILGSMPSEASLKKQQYYGHPRNAFWKIMAELFGFEQAASYAKRGAALKQNRIAVWDVLQACERQGSLDSAIVDSSITENNFVDFFQRHPNIRRVFFNGAKAEKEFIKRVLPTLTEQQKAFAYKKLPSTSPAMASLSYEEKLREWSRVAGSGQT